MAYGRHWGLGITGYQRFHAALSVERGIEVSLDNRILFVRAAKLDQIVIIGESKLRIHEGKRFDRWLDMMESLDPVYHTGESRSEVFWRTLITNTDAGGHYHPHSELGFGFCEWLCDRTMAFPVDFQNRTRRLFPSDEITQKLTRRDCSARLASDYDIQYSHALYQRPFSTSNGYLGLASQSMKEGGRYSVWMVCGSRVPPVFREKKGSNFYELVGGAYVHGFMQGEGLKLDLDFEKVGLE